MPKWIAVAASIAVLACARVPEPEPVAGSCGVETSDTALYDALFEQISAASASTAIRRPSKPTTCAYSTTS